jgi:hypothetical protein
MVSPRRRIIIILVSFSIGCVLAVLLTISRYHGSPPPGNTQNMIVNFAFGLAIVVGLGIFLNSRNKKENKN